MGTFDIRTYNPNGIVEKAQQAMPFTGAGSKAYGEGGFKGFTGAGSLWYQGSQPSPANSGVQEATQSQAPSQYWVDGKNYGSAANYANTQKNEVNMMLDDQESTLRKLLGSVGTQKTQGQQKLNDSYNTEKLAG